MPARVAAGSIALSAALLVVLGGVYFLYDSLLALSQAADSFSDVFTASALLYSMRVGAKPADENHPHGHHRAEPIAALVAAVLAGVLGVEVIRNATEAIAMGSTAKMTWPLAAAFLLKVIGKLGIVGWATDVAKHTRSPALTALRIDARNDVLVGVLALGGFFAARYGSIGWDAWLAIPVGLWIAYSGFDLARESISLLMGEAPPVKRQTELRAIVDSVAGVVSSHNIMPRYEGAGIEITAHIVVDEELSVRKAHDIANTVEERLIAEPDVVSAMIHVDVE